MKVDLRKIQSALDDRGLLEGVTGTLPREANGISDDSRTVERGGLFIAVRGWQGDGHDFLESAAARGAVCAIVEDAQRTDLPALVVSRGRESAALAAATAYGNPAQQLNLIGVTGTNGKTTTTSILRHLMQGTSGLAASVGTLGVLLGSEGRVMPGGAGLTTPGPVELQRVLRALVEEGVRMVAMEVSSHSLDQRRIEGLEFRVALFTNLTRDHLDYHGTMESYREAKARLLDYLRPDGTAIVNADAEEWSSLKPARPALTFGVRRVADIRASDIRYTPGGSEWRLVTPGGEEAVRLPLIGDVNVQNALAAAAAAFVLGVPPGEIAHRLGTVPQVPGRLEVISNEPTVLRDYAHTPDALARALETARAFTRGKLIVMFGCGGDRDKGKRPLMGEIAENGADAVIVTSDNPRTEDPDRIIDDIERGMRGAKHERVTDRRAAIARAIQIADDEDIVLLAGKGHETYQIRGTIAYPFDEKEIVKEIVGQRA
ncbi:MAG TPA: UDP-N-acetylmuramoyl-L-alanyl-D-glutamate--2,6-diaminopimelate ligase [Gemmatimonadaceae bacterium]|nr:UDP-N-acetylmuramoyl-L-alanyl-D-glutamate--2,6-diaminopimelate ligase [Gemmatimonadaceae bacterium]